MMMMMMMMMIMTTMTISVPLHFCFWQTINPEENRNQLGITSPASVR
jgi:hypothetical protein